MVLMTPPPPFVLCFSDSFQSEMLVYEHERFCMRSYITFDDSYFCPVHKIARAIVSINPLKLAGNVVLTLELY